MDKNELTIELGGRSYPARLTLGVLGKAEQKTGRNYMLPETWVRTRGTGTSSVAIPNLNSGDVHALAWALVDHQMGTMALSFEEVGEMLRPNPKGYDLRAALVNAYLADFAPVDEKPDAPFESASADAGHAPASTSDSAIASTAS